MSDSSSLTVPPQHIEAEQSVLGGLMLDNNSWDVVSDRIVEEDFYRKDHRLIFRSIASLAEDNKPFDVITLTEWLESRHEAENAGGLAYLGALAKNTPSAANIRHYADIVRERSILRRLVTASNEIAESAFNTDGRKVAEILDKAEQSIFQIAEQGSRNQKGFEDMQTLLTRAVDRIDKLYSSKSGAVTGIASGFTDFDRITTGLQKSDLIIVAGRPAMGKTSFAMNIAENAAVKGGASVAVFSMEMSGEQLATRLISSLGRINANKVRTGQLEDDDWQYLIKAVDQLKDSNIFIDDTPALTPTELRSRVRRIARSNHGLDLVIIDYLQLMQGSGKAASENRATEISEISRSLKAMAKEMDIPVIALSQLNRSLESRPNRRPVMSDLRECVTGDTKVVLSDGRRVAIEELVGQQPEVVAMGRHGKLISSQSDKVWSVGKRDVFTVKLASGRMVRATKKHRLFMLDGWKRVGEIKKGDRLALSRFFPEPDRTEQWDDLEVALLGQMIGDGSYLSGQPMRYTTNSEENSALIRKAVSHFGGIVKRYESPDQASWHQLLISGNGNRWHPEGVGKWLKELGIFGQRSHQKQVPEQAFRLGNRQVALLLQHLWAADGTISVRKEGQKGSHGVHFSTNSRRLADDVSALLMRLGIVARIQQVESDRYRSTFMVWVRGAKDQLNFLNKVGAFGPRKVQAQKLQKAIESVRKNTNVDTIPEEIFEYVKEKMSLQGISQRKMASMRGTSYGGSAHFSFSPSREVIAEYAELLNDDKLRGLGSNDLFWDRVVEVIPSGEEEVFDLTVPGPSSWLADGMISHNSGAIEQDADIIVFIYRDEVYNEESPDRGTAEIILGKQRHGSIGTVKVAFHGEYTRFDNLAPTYMTNHPGSHE